jgi:hypothetical protein
MNHLWSYTLSKHYSKTTPHTHLIPIHKSQDKVFGTHTFLGPLWLKVTYFGTQVILQGLSFLIGHV